MTVGGTPPPPGQEVERGREQKEIGANRLVLCHTGECRVVLASLCSSLLLVTHSNAVASEWM